MDRPQVWTLPTGTRLVARKQSDCPALRPEKRHCAIRAAKSGGNSRHLPSPDCPQARPWTLPTEVWTLPTTAYDKSRTCKSYPVDSAGQANNRISNNLK